MSQMSQDKIKELARNREVQEAMQIFRLYGITPAVYQLILELIQQMNRPHAHS